MTVPSLLTEGDLQAIWERGRFGRRGLLTEDARPLVVEHPGVRSFEGGPDFRAARLVLGGRRVTGDVEVHLTPSGWTAHGHDRDPAYAGVVLHVVLRRDPFREPPPGPPVLVLEPYLFEAAGSDPEPAPGPAELDALGDRWFAERRARLARGMERRGAEETLYREILVALGYKHNKAAMAELARRCPLSALPETAGEIEARLQAEARALPAGMWRLRNVRPANHPFRRLSGLARFLAAARDEGLARGLARRATLEEMRAWLDPDGTGLIGPDRALEIALNIFVPFLGEEAWRRAAGGPPPALPGALRRLRGRLRIDTVRRYFGALRWARRFDLLLPEGRAKLEKLGRQGLPGWGAVP
ncbi:MAG TPA: DUF2851 family protein [Planctomycetota bacterium]|nr:DUF2851 family protein [Planctomycetota bacterium]